jgi:hypothetical protein
MSSSGKRPATAGSSGARPPAQKVARGTGGKSVPAHVAAALQRQRAAAGNADSEEEGEESEDEEAAEDARVGRMEDGASTPEEEEEDEEEEEEGEDEDEDEDEEDEEDEDDDEEEEEASEVPAHAPAPPSAFDGDAALGVLGDMARNRLARTAGDALADGDGNLLEDEPDTDDDDDDDFVDPGEEDVEDAMSEASDEGFTAEELAQIKKSTDAAGTSTALVPASSSAPAHMDETAQAAMDVVNNEGDEGAEEGGGSSKVSTIERKNRALKVQVTRVCGANSSLREANATLCHALRQANMPIPPGCEQTANAIGEQLTAGQTPIMAGIAPPPPDNPALPDGTPMKDLYCLRQCWLPDTSTISAATKFKLTGKVWPHAIATYQRLRDDLAPICEHACRQIIEFQLIDRRDSTKKVTENVLKPDAGVTPIINFKLECVYDDTNELVTIDSMHEKYKGNLRALADPTCFNQNWTVPMQSGRVKFQINKVFFMSGMSDPIHRKFRYKLTAVDRDFSYLDSHSPAFWIMSKVWKAQHRKVVVATH